MSDHSPIVAGRGTDGLGAYHESALALTRDVDVLIHDAQAHTVEFGSHSFLGHSAIEYAVGLAEMAGARTLVLFHHDPTRTDDEIYALVVAHASDTVEVIAAAEALTIEL